ncbi:DegV family protein [Alicyclobacillus sp. SO9]|uniref:DegV family protein n=1 Tax=Alicyclobacillus sp. SO9 TaxID=2665646 RepID=UPI0018E8C4AE|nr:DegV family protein [Alicyclobacillus sp. SO9]QQE78124.1 DegV family protein [Alicyclobacillus sp. SO9]
MQKISFVTDSTANLTQSQAEEYDIKVVPLSVIFGSEAYREGTEISAEEFYQRLPKEKQLPTTSQPPVGEFAKVFEELLETSDHVVCLMLSSKLSGTYQSAKTAAEMVSGNRITVVDSGIASYGIAGPLMDGVKLARSGGTVEEIVAMWEEELAGQRAFFVVDTLEYLHKGGRIGGAAAVFGALLQIKPILTVIDGRIDLFEKVRTHRRAMERVRQLLHNDAASGDPINLCVVHSGRLDEAKTFRSEITEKYPNVKTEISELGPVIGTHTGPGLIAIVYYPDRLINRQ